jgi:hypothetical protein
LENVDIFYGHLEYFPGIWDILCQFGTFCVDLAHFFLVLVLCTMKNLATLILTRVTMDFRFSGNPTPKWRSELTTSDEASGPWAFSSARSWWCTQTPGPIG